MRFGVRWARKETVSVGDLSDGELLERVYRRARVIRLRRLSTVIAPLLVVAVVGVLVAAGLAWPGEEEGVRVTDRPGGSREAKDPPDDDAEAPAADNRSQPGSATAGSRDPGEGSESEPRRNDTGSVAPPAGEEIRVALVEPAGSEVGEGPVGWEFLPSDSPATHALKVWQKYWNRGGGYHGRPLRFYVIHQPDDHDPSAQRAAIMKARAFGAFAIVGNKGSGRDEAVEQQLVDFSESDRSLSFYEKGHPFAYSIAMDRTQERHLAAELICNQFAGKSPGAINKRRDPTFDYNAPRRWGAVLMVDAEGTAEADIYSRQLKACDAGPVYTYHYLEDLDGSVAGAMARMKTEGVTSIILDIRDADAALLTTEADSLGYYPEYVVVGGRGLHTNDAGRAMSEQQATNAVGISPAARSADPNDWYRAYQQIDPDTTPVDRHFRALKHLTAGINAAGTDLSPASLWEGLKARPSEDSKGPAASGAYREHFGTGALAGRLDPTYVDDVSLIWFDPDAVDPSSEQPGAWRHVWDGTRFGLGALPTKPIPWFANGQVYADCC